jgi:transcriptional regulator with XRE-family HTH domain
MTPLEMRKALGLTQEQLAQKIGYTQRQITRIESGHAKAGPKYTQALQRLLDDENARLNGEGETDLARLDVEFRTILSDLLVEYRRDPTAVVAAMRELVPKLNADITTRLLQDTKDILAKLHGAP